MERRKQLEEMLRDAATERTWGIEDDVSEDEADEIARRILEEQGGGFSRVVDSSGEAREVAQGLLDEHLGRSMSSPAVSRARRRRITTPKYPYTQGGVNPIPPPPPPPPTHPPPPDTLHDEDPPSPQPINVTIHIKRDERKTVGGVKQRRLPVSQPAKPLVKTLPPPPPLPRVAEKAVVKEVRKTTPREPIQWGKHLVMVKQWMGACYTWLVWAVDVVTKVVLIVFAPQAKGGQPVWLSPRRRKVITTTGSVVQEAPRRKPSVCDVPPSPSCREGLQSPVRDRDFTRSAEIMEQLSVKRRR